MTKIQIEELIQELSWYIEGKLPQLQPECAIEILKNLEKYRESAMWVSVNDRLPDAAGVPVLVTGVNGFGQKDVFVAFQGYGDFKWYTDDVTKMARTPDNNNAVNGHWAITHWMELPGAAEGE